jgi:hypothetical protein
MLIHWLCSFAAKQIWEALGRQNHTSSEALVGGSAGRGTYWAPAYGLLCGRYSLAEKGMQRIVPVVR